MRIIVATVIFTFALAAISIIHAAGASPSKIRTRHSFLDSSKSNNKLGQWELLDYNPLTNESAVVYADGAGNTKVRFSVLTSRVIRVETSSSVGFEDRTTLAIVNRMLLTPQFTAQTSNNVLTITTEDLTLKYTIGTAFSASTLSISPNDASSAFKGWYYGMPDAGNLLGTIKSLDLAAVLPLNCTQLFNVSVHDESLHCEWALISRDGWSIVNDTTNYALDSQYWWAGENSDTEDFYFFGFGHDYTAALSDFVQISGKVPLVPRYSLGIWWSRWYDINNLDTEAIVNAYETRALPLDVFIYDMDWHTKYYWGGYTFDSRLFPEPQDTLGYLHSRNLRVAANLHDADGVRKTDSMHDAFARYLGLNPSTTGDIPFSIINATYVYGVEDVVLAPLEKAGMDFWWIDYQQGGTTGGGTGEKQNPTIWTDKVRVTNSLRRGQNVRGITLARWGGLGNHRYQVGFSGDVFYLSWITLAYQPYFTLTASNVAYGFWSHDFVGNDDHELHTRWLQWGAYSPIFRTHDRGMASGACADDNPVDCAIVEVWKVPNSYFEINRAAMQARASLVPYIYSTAREAFDTGVSLIRPMYYYWPEEDMAYAANTTNFGQYMFGNDMLVSPIVAQIDNTTNMANWAVWLPPTSWIEKDTGLYFSGGQVLTKNYDISEVPVYIRDGSIIPTVPVVTGDTIGKAAQQYQELILSVYAKESQTAYTEVYEDNGYTYDYITNNAFAVTTVNYSRSQNVAQINIETLGSFPELPATRTYTIRLTNSFPPNRVTINGVSCMYSRFLSRSSTNVWSYDGPELTTVIRIMGVATSAPLQIQINGGDDSLVYGLKGALNHARLAKLNLDEDMTTPGCQDTQNQYLMSVASTGNQLSYLAGTDIAGFTSVLSGFASNYQKAIAEVQAMHTGISKPRVAYSLALLQSGLWF